MKIYLYCGKNNNCSELIAKLVYEGKEPDAVSFDSEYLMH